MTSDCACGLDRWLIIWPVLVTLWLGHRAFHQRIKAFCTSLGRPLLMARSSSVLRWAMDSPLACGGVRGFFTGRLPLLIRAMMVINQPMPKTSAAQYQ